jgi:hypothetical protein
MTNLKLFAITNVLCVWMAGAPQIDSFEKQALSLVREMPASALDAELPSRSFASWFEQVTGPKAGVVWQLTECGEQIVAPVDALHLNAQSGVIGGDSRFARFPNGNHPRKARPAFNSYR